MICDVETGMFFKFSSMVILLLAFSAFEVETGRLSKSLSMSLLLLPISTYYWGSINSSFTGL